MICRLIFTSISVRFFFRAGFWAFPNQKFTLPNQKRELPLRFQDYCFPESRFLALHSASDSLSLWKRESWASTRESRFRLTLFFGVFLRFCLGFWSIVISLSFVEREFGYVVLVGVLLPWCYCWGLLVLILVLSSCQLESGMDYLCMWSGGIWTRC